MPKMDGWTADAPIYPRTVGDQFHDRQDQKACLDILKRTEKDHARPTEAVQRQMIKSWDMNDESRS